MKRIYQKLKWLGAFATLPLLVEAQQDSSRVVRQYEIDEVVVTGTRNETDVRHLPMTISVVNKTQLEENYRASILPTLTEQVPGLFTTNRGLLGYGISTGASGSMSLRGVGGSTTTGLLVLIDGHPQYMGMFGHPIADSYQSFLAERVEVLRGPASVLYGSNAMGGVINIVTRQMREDGVKNQLNVGYGSYNTLQTEYSNRVKMGKFSSVVTGSYNRTDGHRRDMEFEQYGGYAKLAYDFNTRWKLWGDVNVTHFNTSNPGTVSAPYIDNDSRITRGMTSYALENRYEKTSGAISFFYNWGNHKINDGYHPGGEPQTAYFRSKDQMMGLSLYQSVTLFPGNRVTFGFDYQHFGGESWNEDMSNGEKKPGVDKKQDEVAGYIDIRQDLSSWLSLDAGIRLDHHSHVGTEWVPQGGLAFHLPNQAELKAMVGKGFRNPTIREMYMFPPQNPDLKPEKLVNYELSFSQHLLDKALSYGANLFYINGENMIATLPVNGKPLNINTGEIENWGIEAQVAYRIHADWQVNANYSFLHMENPVVGAPEHKLFAGVHFTHDRWSANTGLQYIKGLYTVMAGDDSTRENFLLWNLTAGYQVCRAAKLFVKGENLLGQHYEI
ncbi:MAG: TonB-dependent receptor plug domain-containing protein, partial [Parabacteroides sp.]